MKEKYRATLGMHGYWRIEERGGAFGSWRLLESVMSEEAAQEMLDRLANPRVIYPRATSPTPAGHEP